MNRLALLIVLIGALFAGAPATVSIAPAAAEADVWICPADWLDPSPLPPNGVCTDEPNLIEGHEHRDVVGSLAGADEVYGYQGPDRLLGGRASDLLIAGPGHDYVQGGPGPDALFGGVGDDTLAGGDARGYDEAPDVFICGLGYDTVLHYADAWIDDSCEVSICMDPPGKLRCPTPDPYPPAGRRPKIGDFR